LLDDATLQKSTLYLLIWNKFHIMLTRLTVSRTKTF